jgi:Rieske Fe-S protein
VYSDQGIVVTQVAAGQFAAFTAECPHQGCLVSEVRDNQIVCPCHMSLFSAETGAVEQGPATRGLAAIPVSDVDGTLVVS